MNQTIQDLYNRKSVRVFTDEPITDDEKNIILNSALQAPTAGNMTLYSILDIREQSLKEELAKRCDNQPFIAKAPLVLIFLADFQKWYDIFKAYCEEPPKIEEADLFLASQDCVIAAQNAVVAAQSMGIVHTDIYHHKSLEETKNMLEKQSGKTGKEFEEYITAFAKRKFYVDFRREMNRSAKAMLKQWTD